MDRWPSFIRSGVPECSEESPSYGSVHPHLASNVRAPVRPTGVEREESCPIVCATSLILVGHDHSFQNESIYQDRSPRWVRPNGPAIF